jgi:tetratricopeptide (TPR) repeat protein
MVVKQALISACPSSSKQFQETRPSSSGHFHENRHVATAIWSLLLLIGNTIFGTCAAAADEDAKGRAQSGLLIWTADGNRDAGPLVFLDRPQPVKDAPAPVLGPPVIGSNGLLLRELVRQAVLSAARDGCGARTRDAVLGEVGGVGKPSASLVLEWNLPRGEAWAVTLRTADGKVLWNATDLLAAQTDPVKLAEVLQRQVKGPLIDALVKAGLKQVDRAPDVVNLIPQDIEQSLDRMTAVAQFAAVRGLHDQLRSHGGSPLLLTSIARGYALLGVLTEHHWHPAHKVFKARALLYGQQAAITDSKGPAGLWSLAFVEALVGRQREALRSLSEADRRGGAVSKPAWVERIRLFCTDEFEKLVEGDAANDPLARLLEFFLAEHGSGAYEDDADLARSRILLTASELLLLETDCFRVHDAACRFSGVSLLHQATIVAPKLFETSIRKSLSTVPGAPADLGSNIPKTLELAASGRDRGEPSLATLGMLIRETRFVQVWRRMDFIRFQLAAQGFDNPPYDSSLVGDHPLRPFLDAYAKGFNLPAFAALTERLMGSDIELTAMSLIYRVRELNPALGVRLFNRAMDHGDEIARDLAEEIRYGPNHIMLELAQRLLTMNPTSPLARAVFADVDPNLDPKLALKWEKDPTAGPLLLGALGRRYVKAQKWDDAERCLTKSIAASPDRWAYRALASVYKVQGQTEKWKETLELFLLQEDYGLDHAQVRNEIARELMSKNQYREALPYAEAAAETGAAWAMITASICRENLGDWKESEAWMRAVSQRYDNQAAYWFMWCKRTEHGDAKTALTFLKPSLPALSRTVIGSDAFNFCNLLTLAGEPRMALELSKLHNDQAYDMSLAVRIVTLADELGDVKLRDQTLNQILSDRRPGGTFTKKALVLVREWLARPDADKVAPDLAKFDAILVAMPQGRGNLAYDLAMFLDHHNRKDEALSYLGLAASANAQNIDERYRVLVRNALKDRGLDPDKVAPRPLPAAAPK